MAFHCSHLYVYGYNYLRSQCAYDVAPGGLLASVYHLTRIEYGIDQPEEVCIKVFAARINPKIPSVFWVWKSADFPEGNLMICWEFLMIIIHV
ncbi:hypothetical protein IC575_031016 [Cucumis melo]